MSYPASMPHGAVLGAASNGVIGYNSNYKHIVPDADGSPYDHLSYVKDSRGKLVYSGDKWQCVEYARRTWISQLDVWLPNTAKASDIWDRKFVKRLSDGSRVKLNMFTSGVTTKRPAVNDLIIWKLTEAQPVGHVAVVAEVTDTHLRVAEQNADNDRLWSGGHWSREFPLSRDPVSGVYTLHDAEDELFGWVRAELATVAPPLPWNPPEEDITSVDGLYGEGTTKVLQKFLGVVPDGQHGQFTDMALAAFLNVQHQSHPHVAMPAPAFVTGVEWTADGRKPVLLKLQNFLLCHPQMSQAGVKFTVVENGELDSATVSALQAMLNCVNLADDFPAAAEVYKNGGPPPRPNLPHGTVLGVAPSGVIGYNCNYDNFPELSEGEVFDQQTCAPLPLVRHDFAKLKTNVVYRYVKDSKGRLTFSGMKWQCVEYARRWWISQLDCYLLNVPRACDIWTRTYVKRLADNARIALRMHDNGRSTSRPAVHDFLIWKRTDEQPVGHIAVVCEVGDDYLCIAEQNVDNNKMWAGGHYSRRFALEHNDEDGSWTIRDDEDPMFGWVRCMKDEVIPTPPFVKPEAQRLPVDGVLEGATATALQIFVGLDAKRDFGNMDISTPFFQMMIQRMTDYALAAFLNTAHQDFPHVHMKFFKDPDQNRKPLISKLQHFMIAYPMLSGAGSYGVNIAVSGDWDEATTRGLQNMLNKIDENEHFLVAVEAYRA